jgi:hypothetical protein
MFINQFDNCKAISVQYQSDAKWVGEQKAIIHFWLNSIAVNLFIFRRSQTILNHGLSSSPPRSCQNIKCQVWKKSVLSLCWQETGEQKCGSKVPVGKYKKYPRFLLSRVN